MHRPLASSSQADKPGVSPELFTTCMTEPDQDSLQTVRVFMYLRALPRLRVALRKCGSGLRCKRRVQE